MTREEYLKLNERFDELEGLRTMLFDLKMTDTDTYQSLKANLAKIEEKMLVYEKERVQELLDNNLENDLNTCLNMLRQGETYSVGMHMAGVSHKIMSEPHLYAQSILEKGLLSGGKEGGGVVENVHVFGTENIDEKLAKTFNSLYVRSVSRGKGGVIVAIPSTMLTRDGRVFIGEYPNDLEFISKSDPRVVNIPINRFVSLIEYLPPEFILGVVSPDINGDTIFTKNDRYISVLPEEEQIALYEKFVKMGLRAEPVREKTL